VDDLLPIGRFARVSGLSIGALRHYDEVSLLRPAVVDRDTGYRRYRAEQLAVARLIARLRDLEVPLDEIRRRMRSNAEACSPPTGHGSKRGPSACTTSCTFSDNSQPERSTS